MTHPIKSPKKLIEVALPLEAINVASAREKSIRHGLLPLAKITSCPRFVAFADEPW